MQAGKLQVLLIDVSHNSNVIHKSQARWLSLLTLLLCQTHLRSTWSDLENTRMCLCHPS